MGLIPGAAKGARLQDEAFISLFQRMPTPAMLVETATDRVAGINRAFQSAFGWRADAVADHSEVEFPFWMNGQHRRRLLERATVEEEASIETTFKCRDGSPRRGRANVSLLELAGECYRLYLFEDVVIRTAEVSQLPVRRGVRVPSPLTAGTTLQQSRDSLSLALEAAQMGIWDWEIGTRLVNSSARAAYLHGLPSEPWKGPLSAFIERVPAKDRRPMRHAFVAICRGNEKRYRLTYRVTLADGEIRWLEATATLNRDLAGKPLRMIGTLVDITDRRRNEQALIESESKFANLFHGSPDPSMLINVEKRMVIEVNQSFVQSFGYAAEQLLGNSVVKSVFWKPGAQQKALLRALDATDSLRGVQVVLRGANGRSHICEMSSSAFLLNRHRCVLLSFRDISARKLAESALKASENKFALAFKASPDSISLTERSSGVYLEVNEGFSRLIGYRADEVLGRSAAELGIWADEVELQAMIQDLDVNGRIHQREMRMRSKHNGIRIVSVSIERLDINDIECLLITARDITEQKLIEARVKHLAYHDALTDLPNRLLLNDRLRQNIALYERHQLKGALLFFDLDHFKHINDSLGHSSGDAVLQEVTRRLRTVVRQEDTVARLGGDEFVVLLSGLEDDGGQQYLGSIQATAEKLLKALSRPMVIEGHRLQLSTSIGIALIPDHGDNPEDLLKRADIALYRVKESGRNGVAFFEQAMQQVASERLSIESELRRALSESELTLHFQPQYHAQTQSILGAEALLRWAHPERGLLGPEGFMEVLEESGMIVEAGAWVLREACAFLADLARLRLVDLGSFTLSVNISPRQFRQTDFVQSVRNIILPLGLPAHCLKLEITEGMVIQDTADTIAKMNELRDLGVRFALDDFGTGYSSLSYLKKLPLDALKIDQSFIRDCNIDSNDAEIVRAIVAIARSLNLEIVAEGVENAEQLAFLQELSCHCYQGYHFSPGLPGEDFARMLAATLTPH
jgi:diguanylate cyclase (GGDEF)-like protein/PAS domain S-box-containing protein